MPRISEEPLIRVETRLFESDHEFLKRHYGDQIGAAKAIRTIIRAHINQVRARADEEINRQPITIASGDIDAVLGNL